MENYYALIIATNYDQGGTSVSPLKGCINDANAFQNFIKKKIPSIKITTLFNQQVMMDTVKSQITRHVNILNSSSPTSSNTFILYFAGHGVNVFDNSGDETDGMDEAIVCYNGMTLLDDWFYENLILKLDSKTKCLLINDCCRSGSIYDLPISYSFDRNAETMKLIPSTKRTPIKDTIKSKCIGISGCADSQYSMEFNQDKNTVRGIFTAGLIEAWTKQDISITNDSCTSIGLRIQQEMDSIWKLRFGYPLQYFKQFVNVSTTTETMAKETVSSSNTVIAQTPVVAQTPAKAGTPVVAQTPAKLPTPAKPQTPAKPKTPAKPSNQKREIVNEIQDEEKFLESIPIQIPIAIQKIQKQDQKKKKSSSSSSSSSPFSLLTMACIAGLGLVLFSNIQLSSKKKINGN